MTTFLLDANVLIAILSKKHDHRDRARSWFESEGHHDWITCPTTQNAVVRIMSGSGFSLDRVTPGAMIESLESLITIGNHRYVPDDASILDQSLINRTRLLASKQVTDTYLLALAVRNDALLATFDRRLVHDAIRDGQQHLYLIQ